jgi:hypothetical protein
MKFPAECLLVTQDMASDFLDQLALRFKLLRYAVIDFFYQMDAAS